MKKEVSWFTFVLKGFGAVGDEPEQIEQHTKGCLDEACIHYTVSDKCVITVTLWKLFAASVLNVQVNRR